jgi:hypothetical protein
MTRSSRCLLIFYKKKNNPNNTSPMKNIINTNAYKHKASASSAINNLCTIIHPLKEEGEYRGEVIVKDRLLGTFDLTYDKKMENSQVDIDVSQFDPITNEKWTRFKSDRHTHFKLGAEGYLVIYASQHHNNVYVRLRPVGDEKKKETPFDTRKLGPDDMVVFRCIWPGSYELQNEGGKQKMLLNITQTKDDKNFHVDKLDAVTVTLGGEGFSSKELECAPLQPIVIKLGTEGAVSFKSLEKREPRKRVVKE